MKVYLCPRSELYHHVMFTENWFFIKSLLTLTGSQLVTKPQLKVANCRNQIISKYVYSQCEVRNTRVNCQWQWINFLCGISKWDFFGILKLRDLLSYFLVEFSGIDFKKKVKSKAKYILQSHFKVGSNYFGCLRVMSVFSTACGWFIRTASLG